MHAIDHVKQGIVCSAGVSWCATVSSALLVVNADQTNKQEREVVLPASKTSSTAKLDLPVLRAINEERAKARKWPKSVLASLISCVLKAAS